MGASVRTGSGRARRQPLAEWPEPGLADAEVPGMEDEASGAGGLEGTTRAATPPMRTTAATLAPTQSPLPPRLGGLGLLGGSTPGHHLGHPDGGGAGSRAAGSGVLPCSTGLTTGMGREFLAPSAEGRGWVERGGGGSRESTWVDAETRDSSGVSARTGLSRPEAGLDPGSTAVASRAGAGTGAAGSATSTEGASPVRLRARTPGFVPPPRARCRSGCAASDPSARTEPR